MSMAVTVMVIVVMLVMIVIVVSMIVTMVCVIAAMLVMAVVMMTVIVMAMPRMTAPDISAAFRIERCFNDNDARAKAAHHLLDHMIAPDAQALADDLRRQMAVAEMPGDPHQMMRIGAADFHQQLGRGNHFDQPPVFQHQRIAAAQRDGFFQIQQEFQPARSRHRHAAAMPVVEIEHHRVSGGPGPANLRADLRGADHDVSFCTSPPMITSILVGEALNGPESARHAFRCGVRRCAAR